jgi:hypothetical protein
MAHGRTREPHTTNGRARKLRSLLAAGACCAVAALAPAAAGAASPAWSAAIDLGLPSGAHPDAPNAVVDSVACAGAGSCAAVGSYTDDSDPTPFDQAMVATRAAGQWSVSELALPGNAAASHPEPHLLSVACGSPGSCSAVGDYMATAGGIRPMVASQLNGTWSPAAELDLPGDTNAAPDAGLADVACAAAGSCTAIGFYKHSSGAYRPMAASEANGTWLAAGALDLPEDAATTAPEAILTSVACGAAGSCAAVGFYRHENGAYRAMAAVETDGTWSPLVDVGLPDGADPGTSSAVLNSVACGGAGSCVAGGAFGDAGGEVQPILTSVSSGSWSTPAVLSAPADAHDTFPAASVDAVACGGPESCAAVGTYADGDQTPRTMVASQAGGTWSPATRLGLPADADLAEAADAASSVACDGPGSCVLASSYVDTSDKQRPIVASLSNGSWSAASALALPANANDNPDAYATSVACGGASSCVLGGTYNGAGSSQRAMVASLDPEAPAPPPSTGTPPAGGSSGGGSGGATPVTGSAPSSPRPLIVLKSAKFAVAKGAIKVKLACQAARCSGTIKLTAKAGGRTKLLGRASYAIARNRTATIAVRLTKAGKKALERSRTRPVRAKLVISVRGAGTKTRTILVR